MCTGRNEKEGCPHDDEGNVAIRWCEIPHIDDEDLADPEQQQAKACKPKAALLDQECEEKRDNSESAPRNGDHPGTHVHSQEGRKEQQRNEEKKLLRSREDHADPTGSIAGWRRV